MEGNIYLEHKAEIQAIGAEQGVDWSVATAMWEVDHQDIVPQAVEERDQMKKAFWKTVDGVQQDE
jgi:hypothetical protein